jgi:hypothetical protein
LVGSNIEGKRYNVRMNANDSADLLRDIREEVIGLLFNRYVFRTHQELVRLNPKLQERPRSIFSDWAQVVYAQATAVGVRRLAGQDPMRGDVNVVGLLDHLIRDPKGLWECFSQHYPEDAARARGKILEKDGILQTGWEISACKRLLNEDRRALISAAHKAVHFASKRVAHSAPDVPVSTTFLDLDDAIDTVRAVTEKYTRLLFTKRLRELEPLHRAGQPTDYPYVRQLSNNIDLLEEMKRRKLQDGWQEIFLETWASPEDIERPLGEMRPPRRAASGH